ncbi:hypothetical protein BJY59DRAFT_177219 [Rhodotorula toruloides]
MSLAVLATLRSRLFVLLTLRPRRWEARSPLIYQFLDRLRVRHAPASFTKRFSPLPARVSSSSRNGTHGRQRPFWCSRISFWRPHPSCSAHLTFAPPSSRQAVFPDRPALFLRRRTRRDTSTLPEARRRADLSVARGGWAWVGWLDGERLGDGCGANAGWQERSYHPPGRSGGG